MRRSFAWLLALSFVFLILAMGKPLAAAAANPSGPTPPPPSISDEEQVQQAVMQSVIAHQEDVLGFLINRVRVGKVEISRNGEWAKAWLGFTDPKTNEPLPTEPGLALAKKQEDGSWLVSLQSDSDWLSVLNAAPLDLLSTEERDWWLKDFQKYEAAMPTAPLTGYLLPWAKGETRYLSQSIGHDAYDTKGTGVSHYAFDFYIHETMWNVYASKAGTVWMYKWDIPNCYDREPCGDNTGNYIILRDTTTNPVTYVLYLHLAYDSIPKALRTIGTPVMQGQFIGVADNTGQSWGDHLHFMVHANANSYYGMSLDITFSDVYINGGRPRVFEYDHDWCLPTDVCTSWSDSYVSGNTVKGDVTPPTGGITSPAEGATLSQPAITVNGWASDVGTGVDTVQLVANFNSAWHDIGSAFTTNVFSYDWNMCNSNVPDGPLDLALRVTDKEGNQTQLAAVTHYSKNYTCSTPQPACVPGPNEVALFDEPDYQGCSLFNIGNYPDSTYLGTLGNNNAASIQVGSNVQATLYSEKNLHARGQTFVADDPNLSDNVIGADALTSMRITPRAQLPLTPTLLLPADAAAFPYGDIVDLYWENGGNSLSYEVKLTGTATKTISSALPYLYLDSLASGLYHWQVRGLNGSGASPWSALRSFSILAPVALPASFTAPYSDTMELYPARWLISSSNMWRWLDSAADSHSSTHSYWYQQTTGNYNSSAPNSGDLTAPPIDIPAEGRFYLRFYYRYETETNGVHWDQRWVQISQDGGPFINVWQLSSDPLNYWLQSPAIDLSAYAGHKVRVRFHFETWDTAYNAYQGWGIDDFSITATPPPACTDTHEPNDMLSQAVQVQYNQTVEGQICPGGDEDFYKFSGSAGDRIVVNVDTPVISRPLDADLYLLDVDGASVLAHSDDEIEGEVKDPHLGFVLPHTGVYYLKMLPWNFPTGSPTYLYSFKIFTDTTDPSANITYPLSGQYLPNRPITLTLAASDNDSISYVDFYWHSSNWANSGWTELGIDNDVRDGWSIVFDPASQGEQKDFAIYAYAYDWAGNWIGAGAWNLGIDLYPPAVSIANPTVIPQSTAFLVSFSGSDAWSGVDYFDLQVSVDGSATWQDYATHIPASAGGWWVAGAVGHTYSFRVRAADKVGNLSAYTAATSAVTLSAPACPTLDGYETDNETGKPITTDNAGQVHNFCNPLSPDSLNDVDIITFNAKAGQRYLIQALPLAGGAAANLALYDTDGATLLISKSSGSLNQPSILDWVAPKDGVFILRLTPQNASLTGSGATYMVKVQQGYRAYLGVAQR